MGSGDWRRERSKEYKKRAQKIWYQAVVLDQSKTLCANRTISGLVKVNPTLACVRPQIPKGSACAQKSV